MPRKQLTSFLLVNYLFSFSDSRQIISGFQSSVDHSLSFWEHFSLSNHSPPYTLTEEKNDFRPSPYHCLMSIPLVLSCFLEKNYLHLMVRACKLVCTITMSTISITTCTMSTMSTTCTTSWLRACQLATLQGGMPTTSCHPATTAPGLQNTPLPPTAKLYLDPKDSL